MNDLSTKIIHKTIENIVSKKDQSEDLSHKLNLWIDALVTGSEDIDNKEDAWDRIEVILNEIRTKNGN
ncbi:hypothetical protein [Fodinibius sp. AD559]|uniref:hypothetical protein n=1 Tax=Fodinibius sp. AD559 TaxID=3424179 RepID=UPI004046F4B3